MTDLRYSLCWKIVDSLYFSRPPCGKKRAFHKWKYETVRRCGVYEVIKIFSAERLTTMMGTQFVNAKHVCCWFFSVSCLVQKKCTLQVRSIARSYFFMLEFGVATRFCGSRNFLDKWQSEKMCIRYVAVLIIFADKTNFHNRNWSTVDHIGHCHTTNHITHRWHLHSSSHKGKQQNDNE